MKLELHPGRVAYEKSVLIDGKLMGRERKEQEIGQSHGGMGRERDGRGGDGNGRSCIKS